MLGTGLRPLSFDVLHLDLAEEAGKAHYPGPISHAPFIFCGRPGVLPFSVS